MNAPLQVNSSFSLTQPNFQLAWDSTSLGLLKECPRKYALSLIYGYVTRAESVHLRFGQEYHAACEQYDHARANGLSHDDALDAAVAYALDATWDRTLQRPWYTDHKEKNRYTLLRTIVWYLDEFGQNDPMKTVTLANGKPAVELSFRMQTDLKIGDEPITFCGHIDRIATGAFDGNTYILDRKTTGSYLSTDYFAKYSPDNQMSMYSFASKVVYSQPVAGIIIDAAQIAVTFSRFQRGLVPRHASVLEEWYKDTAIWISHAYQYAMVSHWPMNDKSCNNYGGCPFRGVCSHVPSMRPEWLAASFVRRTWDPLQARGDV